MKRLFTVLCLLVLLFALPALAEERETSKSIKISIEQDVFLTGITYDVVAEVKYDGSITEEIQICNKSGDVIAVVENDGSGLAQVELQLRETTEGRYYLQGVSGTVFGKECVYFMEPRVRQGEVSEEMVTTLCDVGDDIVSMLKENGVTDGASDEANALVCSMLAADSRIEEYGMNNGNVLFRTVDGLVGCYGFHETDELVFSGTDEVFMQLQEAYALYLDESLPHNTVVASGIPVTNKNILFIAPETTDGVVNWGLNTFAPKLQELADTLDFNYGLVSGSGAVDRLISGDITNCGLLVLMGHGGQLLTDGGFMLTYSLGRFTTEQIIAVSDMLWDEPEIGGFTAQHERTNDASQMEHFYYLNDDTMHLLYTISQNDEGDYDFKMTATRNFFEYVLQDAKFDNTVVCMIVCYAASDARMRNLMLDHGASAYIGTNDPLDAFVSLCVIEELCNMATPSEDGAYLALQDAIDNIDATPTTDLVNEFYATLIDADLIEEAETPYADFFEDTLVTHANEQLENAVVVYTRTADTMNRVWASQSTLSGKVTNSNDEPIAEAEIKLYHWINNNFSQEPDSETVIKTDKDGRYEIKDVPYGQYAVSAESEGISNYVTVAVDKEEVTADTIILSPEHLYYAYLRDVVVPDVGLANTNDLRVVPYYNGSDKIWEDYFRLASGLVSAVVCDMDGTGLPEMLTVTIPPHTMEDFEWYDTYFAYDLRVYQIIDGKVEQTDFVANALMMTYKNALNHDYASIRMIDCDGTVYINTHGFFTSGNSYDGAHSNCYTVQYGRLVEAKLPYSSEYNYFTESGESYQIYSGSRLDDVYMTHAELAAMNVGDVITAWNFEGIEVYFSDIKQYYVATGYSLGRADDFTSLHAIIGGSKDPALYEVMQVVHQPVPTKTPEEAAMEELVQTRTAAIKDAIRSVDPAAYDNRDYYASVSISRKTGVLSQILIYGPVGADPAVLQAMAAAAVSVPDLEISASVIADLKAYSFSAKKYLLETGGYEFEYSKYTPDGMNSIFLIRTPK